MCSIRNGVDRTHAHSSATLVATAAREAQKFAKDEAARQRGRGNAQWGGRGGAADAGTDGVLRSRGLPKTPSLGLAAASLQQEWGKLLKLPSIRTTIRRNQDPGAASGGVATRRRSDPPALLSKIPSNSPRRLSAAAVLDHHHEAQQSSQHEETRVVRRTISDERRANKRDHLHSKQHGHGADDAHARVGHEFRQRGCCHESKGHEDVLEQPVIVPTAPTLAQRLRIMGPPPEPLTHAEWSVCKAKAVERGGVTGDEPCAICMTPFGTGRQVRAPSSLPCKTAR